MDEPAQQASELGTVTPMEWLWWLVMTVAGPSCDPDDRWGARIDRLDRVRAEAFAAADPGRLGDVYVDGSRLAATDESAILDYRARGGIVVGARLQLLQCHVRRATSTRAVVDVVDRLGPARVTWGDGTEARLPRDRPTRRTLTLVRTADGWRIAGAAEVSSRRSTRR
ncbi:MAG: hypothetical protein JWP31_1850 [Aeromicrobium sp.]|nr:hypothetical protein [Aeromicrobium sp.]